MDTEKINALLSNVARLEELEKAARKPGCQAPDLGAYSERRKLHLALLESGVNPIRAHEWFSPPY